MTGIKLILSYHKSTPLIKNSTIIHLHVGRSILKQKVANGLVNRDDYVWLVEYTIGDDTGDNISTMNFQLNELTGIYWVWKNYEVAGNPEYVGFMHYRRLFSCNPFLYKPLSTVSIQEKNVLKKIRLNKLLRCVQKYDVVIPKTGIDSLSNYQQYKANHIISDLDAVLAILKEKYPHMTSAVDEYMLSHRPLYWNMFIMKKQLFIDYCSWLFDIVFEFQKRVDISKRSPQDQRAFWSERLTGIYLSYLKSKKYKILSLPVVWDPSL